MKRSPLGGADDRPRIHLWPHADGVAWSHGPTGLRHARGDHGAALNSALAVTPARGGVVVIIEPHP